MNRPGFDVIVIGAGSNGLAAAAILARSGKRVLVIERAAHAGGQARVEEFAPGFRTSLRVFDNGWVAPSVIKSCGIALPQLSAAQQTFGVAGQAGGDGAFSIPADPAQASQYIGRHSVEDGKRWLDFTKMLRSQASILEQLYQLPAPRIDTASINDALPLLGIAAGIRRSGADTVVDFLRTLPISVADLANDWFTCEPLKAAIAAGGVQGIRQGPRSGGTTFVLLHHLVGASAAGIRGRPHFQAGPDAFVSALLQLCVGRGVQVRTATTAERILITNNKVSGVRFESGEEIPCSAVLSTADPVQTLHYLIDSEWIDPEQRHTVGNIKLRGCTAFVNYAVASLPPTLQRGFAGDARAEVISLTASVAAMEHAYDAVKYRTLARNPHIEVTVPTQRWPHFAPAGKHVLVARVHYVPLDVSASEFGAAVDGAIEMAFPGFLGGVSHRTVLTPRLVEEQYSVSEGSLSHGELTLDQILFMRPTAELSTNKTPVAGLFLGGAGSHPGPGILGGAGTLAARELLRG